MLLLVLSTPLHTAYANEKAGNLAGRVAALELGMNGYIIGTKLSGEKKELSATHLLDDAYQGTYKFSDGELFVVVAQKDDTVLALYQRDEEAGMAQARRLISGLMGLFGEPTAMAHDQLIYWAYNEQGKIPEEKYNKLRDKGERFDVLATVKFNSTLPFTVENPDMNKTGTAYFIISSDPLLQDFISR